ncbi:MAG TPA: hypothetical protein DDY58_01860 [Terrisporobacter glycolicus]|uniref:hypothetical protein n=1 Tax=Terrisporobacter TaxID=1505652 RepID=UPI000E83F849|nr:MULTISPECIES: hypothetical protein [Terrisporobacter]HBI91271.1 hypothetical protein [Terrisporobacter hibernicus]
MKHKYSPVKQYKPRYANPDDLTSLNYLALKAAILDPTENTDVRKYLPPEFFDREESDERMQQIDKDRKKGILTEAQMIKINDENYKYDDIIRKKIEQYKNKQNSDQVRNLKPIKIINKSAGTEEVFSCIKEFCEEYRYKAQNIVNHFKYYKSNEIQYKGLIIERLK